MNIELKRISIYDRMSEETTAFNADLFVNGKKIGEAKNDGHGGCTFYHALPNDESRKLLAEAEAYCKTLPPLVHDSFIKEGETFSMDMTLEVFIDELVDKAAQEKEKSKFAKIIAKKQLSGIVVGNDVEIGTYTFKGTRAGKKVPITIEEMLKTDAGKTCVIKTIQRAKSELRAGEKILNDNIPAEIMAQVN